MSVALPSWEKVPAYHYDSPESAAIIEATTNQALAAADAYEDLKAQIYPLTATWSLPLWEAALGLVSESDTPIEQRRAMVCSALDAVGTTTEAVIEALASRTGYQAHVTVDSADYSFTVRFSGVSSQFARINREQLIEAIERVKPAHLRCIIAGVTWAHVEAAQLTWAYLDEHQITWTDAEYYIPLHDGA